MSALNALVGIVVYFLVAALVIWIVSKLNLGLSVDGYTTAILAAVVIAIVGGVVYWLIGLFNLSVGGGFCGAIINLIVAALVLMFSGRVFKGLQVKGFGGAIIAAIAIGVVGWIITWLLSLVGLA